MTPLKSFVTNATPTWEELQEAKKIAEEEKCVVELKWFVKYNGWFNRYIYEDTDIEKMNEYLRHIIYGM